MLIIIQVFQKSQKSGWLNNLYSDRCKLLTKTRNGNGSGTRADFHKLMMMILSKIKKEYAAV